MKLMPSQRQQWRDKHKTRLFFEERMVEFTHVIFYFLSKIVDFFDIFYYGAPKAIKFVKKHKQLSVVVAGVIIVLLGLIL